MKADTRTAKPGKLDGHREMDSTVDTVYSTLGLVGLLGEYHLDLVIVTAVRRVRIQTRFPVVVLVFAASHAITEVTLALFPKCVVDGVESSGVSFEFPGASLLRKKRVTSCTTPLLESLHSTTQRKQSNSRHERTQSWHGE